MDHTWEIVSQFCEKNSAAISTLLSALASMGTCIAAYLAYKSILVVKATSRDQFSMQKKSSTITFISNNPLIELTRPLDAHLAKLYPLTDRYDNKLESYISLNDYGLSKLTIKNIEWKIKRRIPLNHVHGLPKEIIDVINEISIFRRHEQSFKANEDVVALFNKIEEISNAVNSEVIDLPLFDKMYGGVVLAIYSEHSDWLVYIKRRLGLRYFDQTDILVSKLLERSCARYNLKSWSNLLKIMIMVPQGFRLSWLLIRMRGSLHESITRSRLIQLLSDLNNFDKIIPVDSICLCKDILISDVLKSKKFNRRSLADLTRLFNDALQSSKGVWPVGIASWLEITNDIRGKSIPALVRTWVLESSETWTYEIKAYKRDFFYRQLIGFMAITISDKLLQQKDRWNSEILTAINRSGLNIATDTERTLSSLCIPYTVDSGIVSVDLSRMAMLKSFYVDSKVRNSPSYKNIGRRILRKAIFYCRNELNLTPFLTVLGDEEYTEAAISLYISEGGSFVGTCRDANNPNGHLMHVFIF